MIELWPDPPVADDARRKQRDAKPEPAQHLGEEAIELVTETSALSPNDLVEQSRLVENDLAARRDVQVLEGHRTKVSEVQPAERRLVHGGRFAVTNAIEVGADVDGHRRCSSTSKPTPERVGALSVAVR